MNPSQNVIRYIVGLCLWLFVGVLFAQSDESVLVRNIAIQGNEKTLPGIILQELSYQQGEIASQHALDQTSQAVKDLGLFQAVDTTVTPNDDGSVSVLIEVKEKRYTFVLPKLNRNGDGDITTGIVWRTDNMFGRNQQSKFTVAYRKFDDSEEEDETQIKWEFAYPRIPGTPYSLDITVLDEETLLEETLLEETIGDSTGEYERSRSLARFLVGRWLKQDGPSQGLNLKFGPYYERYDHEFVSGVSGLLPDLSIHAAEFRLDGYYVHDNLLSRSGHHFGYDLTISDDVFGSDRNFVQHFFFYRKFLPISGIEHQNLNLQFRLGHISDSVLGPPEFKIGGSRALRGYDRDEVEGNTYIIFNAEYLRPMFNKETLRGALFLDIGNAWEDPDDIALNDLRYAAGLGLRWKLKRFVRTDVRLDIAHGFSDGGETKAYLSTRATF